MSTESLNIAIAGAGLMGRVLAWRLSLTKHRLTLFESSADNEESGPAWTAAAMISPLSEVVVSEKLIYDLGIKSLALWKKWLSEDEKMQAFFHQKGSLVIAHPQDENELQQFHQELEFHLGTQHNCQWLNRRELTELEADVAENFEHGLYLPNEAHLDHRELLTHLKNYLQESDIIKWNSKIGLNGEASVNGQAMEKYDLLIDCRGCGAKESNPEVRGVRGEVIHVQTGELSFSRPVRLMHPRYKLYIVPKPNNNFILGATELESEDRSPVSVKSSMELCSALYTINPAFAEARIVEMDVNLRPTLPNNLPKISESYINTQGGQRQKIISVNGLYRHGYLLAPALIDQLMAELQ